VKDCWIMFGGPSADKKLTVDGDIISVNKDMFRYPESKYTITMDNRFTIWELYSKHRRPPSGATNFFVVNMGDENIRHTTAFTDMRWGMSYDLSMYDVIIKSYRVKGMGLNFKNFSNGGNSGYCALQLAICLGYKNIHLVGLDLCSKGGKTHHHEGYPKSRDDFEGRCAEFEDRFRRVLLNEMSHYSSIKLINHSPISKLRDILGYELL
jgi:hypothetical protein